jgi:hypothetical protein
MVKENVAQSDSESIGRFSEAFQRTDYKVTARL